MTDVVAPLDGPADFPPIAEYGFLSDCQNSCLIAPDGSVEWLCLPRPDAPSVFGALLDRTAGSFRFGPTSTLVPHQRRYVPGTMVLETTWHTPTGWLVVQDLLVVQPTDGESRRPDYRRPLGDSAATGTLLRFATCIDGRVEVVANIVARVRVRLDHRRLGVRRRRLRRHDCEASLGRPRALGDVDAAPGHGRRPLLRPHHPRQG